MTAWTLPRLVRTLAISLLLWLVVAGACCCVGSDGHVGWPQPQIRILRLETVFTASVVGAALAAAGVVYQALLRNPLADPYLLGVSSGASLAAYLWGFQFASVIVGPTLVALGQQCFAFLGAMVAVAVVFGLASRRERLEPVTLLLVGVIVNAISGSIFLLVNSLWPERLAGTGSALAFLVGGIQSNLSPAQRYTASAVFLVGWIVLFQLSGDLNVAGLDEAEAESLGVRLQPLRWTGLLAASLITAAAIAISGPIGFIGLVCPHLARLLVGYDQRRLLPLATALGAALLALADAGSRLLLNPAKTLLPVGVLTSMLGGPFFLLLLWRGRRRLVVHSEA